MPSSIYEASSLRARLSTTVSCVCAQSRSSENRTSLSARARVCLSLFPLNYVKSHSPHANISSLTADAVTLSKSCYIKQRREHSGSKKFSFLVLFFCFFREAAPLAPGCPFFPFFPLLRCVRQNSCIMAYVESVFWKGMLDLSARKPSNNSKKKRKKRRRMTSTATTTKNERQKRCILMHLETFIKKHP